jgi:hypothetical protein
VGLTPTPTNQVKIAWAFSFKGFLTWGVSPHQQGSALFDRALLLWAVCLTFVFSALTLLLQRWRGLLESNAAASDGAARAAAGLDWRALCVQYLLLLEATFGWVTGCAWTDALVAYTPLGENTIERPWVAAEDVLVASAFTALGVLWLVSSGQAVGASAAVVHHARAHAEAAFATNALCFFVGWSWVVVLRDGTAMVFLALARYVASLGDSARTAVVGSSRNETLAEEGLVAELGFVVEGCTAFLLGPGLTVVALWAGMSSHVPLGSAPARSPHTPALGIPWERGERRFWPAIHSIGWVRGEGGAGGSACSRGAGAPLLAD